jgi:hypothetical protein
VQYITTPTAICFSSLLYFLCVFEAHLDGGLYVPFNHR